MDKLKVPAKTTLIYSGIIFVLVVVNITLLVLVSKEKQTTIVEACVSETSTEDETSVVTDDIPADHPCRDFRLSKDILPLHYDILLQPDMENDTFYGLVNITINVTTETSHIIFHLHSKTNITNAAIYSSRNESKVEFSRFKKHFRYQPNDFFVIDTDDKLKPGTYVIMLRYVGYLRDDKRGFFKMNYINSNNETRSVVASKFQPIFARHAFPCFDEPGFKSTYNLQLVHSPNYIALSNMPVESTHEYYNTGLVITKFQRSVPMVTYLAEFIVCDFKFTRTMSTKGKPMRVYSVPDKINQTQHALIFGRRVLDYFEYYFGLEYPLPKYDMISFPEWSSGGTEHWGIVTFPDKSILYDEEKTLPYDMQRLTTVISHEAAHMWFGNLVTAEWWKDIWLHEGFASYIEYLGIQELHPDWDIMSQFVIEDMQHAIYQDSSLYSSPIIKKANANSEISFTFSGNTYKKGATILRMMESFMGKETFRSGISNFLKKFKYKNVETSDLWKELSAVYKIEGNHTFASVMKPWTEGVGIPYVTIKREGNNFIAKQKRYFGKDTLKKKGTSEVPKTIWSIPLSYKSSGGGTGVKWIHGFQEKFTLPVLPNETVKFNVDHTGYYIVNYEREEWDKLIHLLLTSHEALSPLDRSNLLFDATYLSETVQNSLDTFMSLTRYLRDETHYVPWKTVYSNLIQVCEHLVFTDVDILCKNYIYGLTEKIYKKVEWKRSKNHLQNLLNPIIIELACYSRNQHCLTKASEMFQNWTQGQSILPELRDIIIRHGMAEIGRDEHFTILLNKFSMETDSEVKRTYMRAFAEIKVPHLIRKFMQYLLRKNDSVVFMDYLIDVSENAMTRPYVISIIQEHWPHIKERFQQFTISNLIDSLTWYITSDSELNEVKDLFDKYRTEKESDQSFQYVLDRIVENIKWVETYMDDLKLWFHEEGVNRFKYNE